MATKQLDISGDSALDSDCETATKVPAGIELTDAESCRPRPDGGESERSHTDDGRHRPATALRACWGGRGSCGSRGRGILRLLHTTADLDSSDRAVNQHLRRRQTLNRSMSDTASTGYDLDLRSDTRSVSSRINVDGGHNVSVPFRTMTPRPGRSEMPASIAVSGLQKSKDNTERLTKYFSATCQSGGDKIRKHKWDEQNRAFIITFGSNEVVKRVLARTHKRCGVQLEVIPAELDDDDDADDLCRTFSVTCALEEVDVCAVYNYLREEAGVCGVKRLENDGNNKKIVVIVDSSADMARVKLDTNVSQSQTVMIEGRIFTLTRLEPVRWVPWIEGDVEQNAVYLSLIDCDFSHEDVTRFFEPWCSESRNAVVEVRTGNGRALVHFENSIGDFKALRRWVQQRAFKAEMVAVEKVPASTRIRISNFPCTEHCQQDLADHFACVAQQHCKSCLSGGACDAEVNEDDIRIFPDEHYVTVKFHCRPVLDCVLSDGSYRTFHDRQLDVSMEYDV